MELLNFINAKDDGRGIILSAIKKFISGTEKNHDKDDTNWQISWPRFTKLWPVGRSVVTLTIRRPLDRTIPERET